jgi:hypothetical protein
MQTMYKHNSPGNAMKQYLQLSSFTPDYAIQLPSRDSSESSRNDNGGSLYSIPEDSREDLNSDYNSKSGSNLSQAIDFGVEMSFVEDTKRGGNISVRNATLSDHASSTEYQKESASNSSIEHQADQKDFRPLVPLRLFYYICLAFLFLLVIVISATQINRYEQKQSRVGTSLSADQQNDVSDTPSATPSAEFSKNNASLSDFSADQRDDISITPSMTPTDRVSTSNSSLAGLSADQEDDISIIPSTTPTDRVSSSDSMLSGHSATQQNARSTSPSKTVTDISSTTSPATSHPSADAKDHVSAIPSASPIFDVYTFLPTLSDFSAEQSDIISTNPSVTPTYVVTDTKLSDLKLSEEYVYSALWPCPGKKTFFDADTRHGKVFTSLVNEVYQGIYKDDNGIPTFNQKHGIPFLQEKFGLSMLYEATNGDNWTRQENWLSASDPCDDWLEVTCKRRDNDKCAVTGLELGEYILIAIRKFLNIFLLNCVLLYNESEMNNLSGTLPQELCCLPCLQFLHMANNDIGGAVLTCLVSIPTLQEIDFVNNNFSA